MLFDWYIVVSKKEGGPDPISQIIWNGVKELYHCADYGLRMNVALVMLER